MIQTMGLRTFSLLAVVWFALFVGSNAEEHESEQERRPIKTFKTIHGEIIDCIDIYKQPAFDHPLLKDHKLRKRPSFSPDAAEHRQRAQVNQLERSHDMDGCPDGTIPILRTTKEDRIRAKLLEQTRPPIFNPSSTKTPGFHFAFLELPFYRNTTYHGAKAYIDNYLPKCEKGQASGAEIVIINNIDNPTTMIHFGWKVDPDLFGDDQSHLFIYWTVNGGGGGCYNLMCPGFVQVDRTYTLGGVLRNNSVYGGVQFETRLAVYQDMKTKDWWFVVQKDEVQTKVGYWPANLLPELLSGAKTLQWGGMTHTSNGLPYPQMGSGFFPDKSYNHACYFRQIHYTDGSETWIAPENWQGLSKTSSKSCYGSTIDNHDDFMGYTLLFGGPGGAACGE